MILFGIEGEKLFPEEFGYFDLTYFLCGLRHLNGDLFGFGHHVVKELDDEKEGAEECLGGVFGEAVDRLAVYSFADWCPQELYVFNDVH